MPWNLSISLVSVLLKNLVLIRLSVLSASPFRWVTKRIRELLSKVEALDCLYYERESPRIYRERSAISRNTVEIVQISTLLEKQKRFISICYIISYLLCWYVIFGLMRAKIDKLWKMLNKKVQILIDNWLWAARCDCFCSEKMGKSIKKITSKQ